MVSQLDSFLSLVSVQIEAGRTCRQAAPRRWSLVVMGHHASPMDKKGVWGYVAVGKSKRG